MAAERRDLTDAMDHVSSVWGAVQIDAAGAVTFERLADAIEEVGLQTRKPPTTKEPGAEWHRLGLSVHASLFTARSVAALEAVRARAFYADCNVWSSVVSGQLVERAPAFFTWLNPRQSPPR